MLQDFEWIGLIDHRISAAVVFFVLLPLLNRGKRRTNYPLRLALIFFLMTLSSWVLRTLSDEVLDAVILQGLCYSLQLCVLHLLYLWACFFCYKMSPSVALYESVLATTIFKISWNLFKTGSSIFLISRIDPVWGEYSLAGSLFSYAVYLICSALLCFLYRDIVQDPASHAPVGLMVGLTCLFIPLHLILEYIGHVFTAGNAALFLYYLCALLYTILNYATLIMIALLDSFRHENRNMHDFISNKMRYYEMSHDGIVNLQTKCHDLKHQIHAIRSEAGKSDFDQYLSELEDSINAYSTVVECGHPTVDIVLTEKNILCLSAHVNFTYMIDGALFSFLSERDIYSLFGNALDNAWEATSKLEDESQRIITLKGNRHGEMVVMQVENTFECEIDITQSALPHTTKKESGHGFGLRSIQRIAEKYGGIMDMKTEPGIFRLTVVLNPSIHA
ncbi:MAG: sensor histidine kinase [Clostridia bacterium]|nr:sensor histidine kinase [Clostridia bacterium]